jgi:hypothetical protein
MRSEVQRNNRWLPIVFGSSIAVLGALAYLFPVLVSGVGGATRQLADDYFYYLKIAENLRVAHASTYNGLVPTNGYHPLWLLINWALLSLAGGIGVGFYAMLLALLALLLGVAGFLCFRTCQRLDVAPPAALFSSAALILFVNKIALGMEVTLTVPLFLAYFLYVLVHPLNCTRHALTAGFLGGLTILSRLDAATLVGSVMLAELVLSSKEPLRGRVQRALLFGAGMLPVVAYACSNQVLFGHLLPISAVAKSIIFSSAGGSPNFLCLSSSADRSLQLLRLTALFTCAVTVGLVAVRAFRRRETDRKDYLVMAVGFGALFTAGVMRCREWPWYYYQLALGLALCSSRLQLRVMEAVRRQSLRAIIAWTGACLPIVAVLVTGFRGARAAAYNGKFVSMNTTQAFALREFEHEHPGTYAMGDRAGLPGVLLSSPIVQLEGLVMDQRFSELIRRGTRLEEIFRIYGIDYYVTIGDNFRVQSDCYEVYEPAIVGNLHASMRGHLCVKPHAFAEGGLVFDVRPLRPPR